MEGTTMSPADIMAMMNNGNANWNNNPFIWLVWLAMFGNGVGWNNGNYGNSALQNSLTRAEMGDGFANQNLHMDIKGIQNAVHDGFAGTNINANSNTNDIIGAVTRDSFGTQNAIHDLQSTDQMGFCSVNNSIGNLKYEMAQNCCDLKTAMHAEGEMTRGLIQQNTIQDLRDKLADKAADLQSAQLTLANAAQTQNLLSALGSYSPTCNCNGSRW